MRANFTKMALAFNAALLAVARGTQKGRLTVKGKIYLAKRVDYYYTTLHCSSSSVMGYPLYNNDSRCYTLQTTIHRTYTKCMEDKYIIYVF